MSSKNGTTRLPSMQVVDPFVSVSDAAEATGRPLGTIGTWKKKGVIRSNLVGHVSLDDAMARSKVSPRHKRGLTRSSGAKTGTQVIEVTLTDGTKITGLTTKDIEIRDGVLWSKGGDSCL